MTTTTSVIQPIETRYGNRHFRSRLEARWAVYFDVAGIEWDYEPEKFKTDNGQAYIPDFWLPGVGSQDDKTFKRAGAYFEVKGPAPDEEAIDKAYSLSRQTKKSVFIFWGPNFGTGHDIRLWYEMQRFRDWKPIVCEFRQCPHCGTVSVGTLDHHFCIEAAATAKKYDVLSYFDQELEFPAVSPMLALCREAAQSARFESPEWVEELKGICLSSRRMREQRIFCAPQVSEMIITKAHEWAADKRGGPYEEPWWEVHAANLASKTGLCDCYSCEADRERAKVKV